MRKLAIVFVFAVITPSLVLAWLAVRSLRDQQFVLERQQSLLYQGVADSLAQQVQQEIAERQREFAQQVESFCGKQDPASIAPLFDDYLRKAWPWGDVAFAVSLEAQPAPAMSSNPTAATESSTNPATNWTTVLTCPPLPGRPEGREFRLENEAFLSSSATCVVVWNSPKGQIKLSTLDEKPAADSAQVKSGVFATKKGGDEASAPTQAKFIQIVGDAHEGTLARFLQDQLRLLFWYRSPRDPSVVFGAQLNLEELVKSLKGLITVEPSLANEIVVALLDDNGRAVALTQPQFVVSRQRPFVVGEIGEVLPHWEVAVYLLDPARLGQTAQTARLTLGLLIVVLLIAIGVGSFLIVADVQRHLRRARQKTDFVSNVSHELKTPLTSIRMFAEMLSEDRVAEPAKRRQFHQIIASEASRLTRLINNVLDFARTERGEKKYNFARCDLNALVAETTTAYRPHLETAGFRFDCQLSPQPVPVQGDRDALAQVLVNLLSNAEKYSGERKEVTVKTGTANRATQVTVLDRGLGVPRGCEERIFEQFFRAHDSLSSGIQGSGLGLTLARQIARAHGGDVTYAPREGGGSCFTLRLPLTQDRKKMT